MEQRLKAMLSSSAWRKFATRALVLIVLLAGIKAFLVIHFGHVLYETHIRPRPDARGVVDIINFALAGVLLAGSFAAAGWRARNLPVKNLCWFSIAFVVIGLAFAILSMNRINNSYAYAVMKGFVPLRGIGAYLAMDFFFAPPFLAAYVGGYALLYWVFAKTKREHWTPFILGGVALLYWWLHLRQLYEFRRALLVVNCFGIGSLVALLLNRPPKVRNAAILAGATALMWLLFQSHDSDIGRPHATFVLVLCITLALFVPALVLLRRTALFGAAGHFFFFWAVAFLLLANQGYPLSDNYNYLVSYAAALPHYIACEVLLVALLTAGALWLSRRSAKGAAITFDLGAILILGAALADVGLARTIGVRADWNLLTMSNDFVVIARTIAPYAWQMVAAAAVCFGIYRGLSWLASRRKLERLTVPGESHLATGLQWLFVGVLVAFALERDKAEGFAVTHVVATSPLLQHGKTARLSPEEFVRLSRELNLHDAMMQTHQTATAPTSSPEPHRPNVVLILLESTYNKYLSLFGASDETQPRLKKYLNRMELFPNFYSVFPNSFHARFAVLSGLYPTREYASYLNPRIDSPSLPEILSRHGYRTSLFQSDSKDYVRFSDYIARRGLDVHCDSANMPGKENFKSVAWGVEEAATLNAIRKQFAAHAAKRERFFLSYMPVAPHMPYDTPAEEFRKFPSGYETITHNYSGRYKNQLLYIDWVIASMLDELASLGLLDDTLFIITNDHGEMIGDEDGKLGHGWLVRPDMCNTPLIVMPPGRTSAATNYVLGSQVDLLPTILDLLKIPLPANNLYEGRSLYDTSVTNKTIYLTSHQQRGLIHGSRYVVEDRTRSEHNPPTLVYEISHAGTKSVYTPVNVTTNISSVMDRFEKFQTSFIINYSAYRNAMRSQAVTSGSAATQVASGH